MRRYNQYIMVCNGIGCDASESEALFDRMESAVKSRGLSDEVQVTRANCMGCNGQGQVVRIYPGNIVYVDVKPEDAEEIIDGHIVHGKPVEHLLYIEPDKNAVGTAKHKPFYKKQTRIALRNCGVINPEDIYEYIAFGGYEALGKAVTGMTPSGVIDMVKKSGLRGRGGGGFPTGLKWEIASNSPGEEKYIFCNADEGDPGAFMDRSILEGDPHSVIEALAIGGYAIGAHKGFIYIRAEYPLAIRRLEMAISQARELGLLGDSIFGTGFCFSIELKLGAGAFVCGEETALLHSAEGKRGEPHSKPPYPSEKGYWDMPTCVNNVETFASIPPVIIKGPEWFASIGTEKSKGTKVFALAGAVRNVGLAEVPMGTTLREIIYEIGGGIRNNRAFKAVQTGGPSGGVIPEDNLDTPIDYDSLREIGSMMGSGGMIVIDDTSCMIDFAKFYLNFTQDESCGRCTPCRVGTTRMYEIIEKISEGRASMEDIDNLHQLAVMIKDTSLCGLGQSAPNPVLSTLKHFMEEYEAHVLEGYCPAGKCKGLVKYTIDPARCTGCTACARVCPVKCISGEVKKIHRIDQSKCIKCDSCFKACRFGAVIKPGNKETDQFEKKAVAYVSPA